MKAAYPATHSNWPSFDVQVHDLTSELKIMEFIFTDCVLFSMNIFKHSGINSTINVFASPNVE